MFLPTVDFITRQASTTLHLFCLWSVLGLTTSLQLWTWTGFLSHRSKNFKFLSSLIFKPGNVASECKLTVMQKSFGLHLVKGSLEEDASVTNSHCVSEVTEFPWHSFWSSFEVIKDKWRKDPPRTQMFAGHSSVCTFRPALKHSHLFICLVMDFNWSNTYSFYLFISGQMLQRGSC